MTATHSFEIELTLSGSIQPAEPDVGICAAYVEDVDIEDIGVVRSGLGGGRFRWTTHSILDGVDRQSAAYQQIIANILALVGDEAREAVMEDACE